MLYIIIHRGARAWYITGMAAAPCLPTHVLRIGDSATAVSEAVEAKPGRQID